MTEQEPRRDGDAAEPASGRPASDGRPSDRPAEPAETQEHPGLSDTAEQPSPRARPDEPPDGDATAIAPVPPVDHGPAGTSVMPTVPGRPPEPATWSARARVPSPEPAQEVPPRHAEWEEEAAEQPSRGYLVPALVTLCVLLLLLLGGVGVWLLLRNRDVTPVPAPSLTTPAPAVTTPPTTRPPATPTTTAAPAAVPIPNVAGMDYDSAAGVLTNLGFVPKRQDETNPNVPAGQVIGTEPPAGNQVRPGTTITIIVSAGAPTKPPTTPSPTAEPT